MKKNGAVGLLCVFGSAVIFGFTPILAAISYHGGNNGINMAFLRAIVPIPLLLYIARKKTVPTGSQCKNGFIAGCLSFGCTILLYSSYEYISPGLATTLHFLYPLYVTIYESVKNRQNPGALRFVALGFGLIGSLMFLDTTEGEGSMIGTVLALASGIAYALYIIALGKEAQKPMHLCWLMILVSISGTVVCGTAGLALRKITCNMSATAWVCAAAVALLTAVVGSMLFQKGVREVGAANAAIFSLFEPITSVVFSVLLLDDTLTVKKITGIVLILCSLLLTSLHNLKAERIASSAPTSTLTEKQ